MVTSAKSILQLDFIDSQILQKTSSDFTNTVCVRKTSWPL